MPPMYFLDLTLKTPEENLALDEALLEAEDHAKGREILRFWEADRYFVVLGCSNQADRETHRSFCKKYNIPIFRRSSGGGTVLQGPGCLNFALILRIQDDKELRNITSTNSFIMDQHKKALEPVLRSDIRIQGYTDLTLDGKKFSGNAQRRKRHALLFHGSFLLRMDLGMIEKTLQMPSRLPAYREERNHEDFLINLPLSAEKIRKALKKIWKANRVYSPVPNKIINGLIQQKLSNPAWNFRF